MKTIKFGLLLAFLSSPIFIFSSFRPQREPVLQTTIHPDAALNRLRVLVTRPHHESFTLRVLAHNDWPVHEQYIPGGSTRVQATLNLGALPDGTYRVEVVGKSQLHARQVSLSPSEHPVVKRRIDIRQLY